MKPAEKQVLKAGMITYLESMVRREIRILEQVRREMHLLRSQKPSARPVTLTDWEGFKGIVNAQIMVIRRTRLALLAAELVYGRVGDDAVWDALDEKEQERTKDFARRTSIEQQLREAGRRQWDSDNDPRWKDVNDDTIVMWDKDGQTPEPCRWGGLMQADRKTVEMHEDGSLHGGYPF